MLDGLEFEDRAIELHALVGMAEGVVDGGLGIADITGGGITEALGEPFLSRIRESFKRDVFPAERRGCDLVMTRLRADAGLLGAALLARASLER